jgi:hypothetical protein
MIVLEPQSDLNKACVGYYAKEDGPCLIYDYRKLVECFMASGMTEEEAVEWVDYNIVGAYFGPQNPVIMEEV